jgi:hypothetical protein
MCHDKYTNALHFKKDNIEKEINISINLCKLAVNQPSKCIMQLGGCI